MTRVIDFGTIPLQRQRYFIGTADSRSGWSYPLHTHQGFGEFFYVVRGRVRHGFTTGEITLRVGDLLLIRESDTHDLDAIDHSHVNLNVPLADFERVITYLDGGPRLRQVLADKRPTVRSVPPDLRQDLTDRLRRLAIAQLSESAVPLYQQVLVELCHLIMATEVPAGQRQAPPWLADALALCNGQALDLTPARLAHRLGVTHAHLARTFRQHLGHTPGTHLQRVRIAHAAELLEHSDQPVLTIGIAAGFRSPSAFYRRFVDVYGMPPGDYRKSLRNR